MTDDEFCTKMEVDLLDSFRDGYITQEEMFRLIALARIGAAVKRERATVTFKLDGSDDDAIEKFIAALPTTHNSTG